MILFYMVVLNNILGFALFGIDKKRAENGRYRVSEASLILNAVFGGALGCLLGMKVFHHKTKKKKFTITIPLLLILWTVFLGFCLYQNYHLVVTEYDYNYSEAHNEVEAAEGNSTEEKVQQGKGLRIVQISDLHNQIFGFQQSDLLDRIEKCNPDIIVVTGDVVDQTHTCYTFSKDFFKGAVEIAPTFYVTGNHEKWLKGEALEGFIKDVEDMGVQYIDDKVVRTEDYIIAGVAETTLGDDLTDVYTSEDKESGKLKILLAHEPAYHDDYEKSGADLVFTGHIHGGQIILPGVGGLLSPGCSFLPEIYEGEHTFGETRMYVSRGLGNSVLPVRINDYPEIVVVNAEY